MFREVLASHDEGVWQAQQIRFITDALRTFNFLASSPLIGWFISVQESLSDVPVELEDRMTVGFKRYKGFDYSLQYFLQSIRDLRQVDFNGDAYHWAVSAAPKREFIEALLSVLTSEGPEVKAKIGALADLTRSQHHQPGLSLSELLADDEWLKVFDVVTELIPSASLMEISGRLVGPLTHVYGQQLVDKNRSDVLLKALMDRYKRYEAGEKSRLISGLAEQSEAFGSEVRELLELIVNGAELSSEEALEILDKFDGIAELAHNNFYDIPENLRFAGGRLPDIRTMSGRSDRFCKL